jgi:hypothetical protein
MATEMAIVLGDEKLMNIFSSSWEMRQDATETTSPMIPKM